nr:hypothetical protein [Spirochaetota bacterium]
VAIISLFLLYVMHFLFSCIVFINFKILDILIIAVLFFLLLVLIQFVLNHSFFADKIVLNRGNILTALIISLILFIFGKFDNMFLGRYFQTFPILEAENGLGFHQDTAYHVAIIQSIKNFGYPSIGQHGSIPTFYHVLSHYIDAFVLKLSGISPYDSYGLLYQFKIFILLTSFIIFMASVFNHISKKWFTIFVSISTLIVVNTWHVIGSHGLWFTIIILFASMPKIIKSLFKPKQSTTDLLFIFIIAALLSLGKISSGFMFAIFIGFYLLLKEYGNFKIYLLGAFWVLFYILIFSLLTTQHSPSDVTSIFNSNPIENFVQYASGQNRRFFAVIINSLFFFTFYQSQKPINSYSIKFGYSSIISIILCFFIFSYEGFTSADRSYFFMGLFFVQILTVLYVLFSSIDKNYCKYKILVILLFCYMVLPNSKSIFSKEVFHDPYGNINSILEKNEKLSMIDNIFVNNRKTYKRLLTGPLTVFTDDLHVFLENNQLKKNNVYMFIPKKVFDNEIDNVLKKSKWSQGTLIYAVTGIPLIYGVESLSARYGFANYGKESLRRDESSIDPDYINSLNKKIIIVKSFNPPKFVLK